MQLHAAFLTLHLRFQYDFIFHLSAIVDSEMFVPFIRPNRSAWFFLYVYRFQPTYASFFSMTFRHYCGELRYSISVELLSLARKRNVPIRFCNLPKKASSHCWSIFLTSEISDDLSVQDQESMVDGVERAIQIAPIFVLWRWTRGGLALPRWTVPRLLWTDQQRTSYFIVQFNIIIDIISLYLSNIVLIICYIQ